jgi:hypothetical protein
MENMWSCRGKWLLVPAVTIEVVRKKKMPQPKM